MSTRGKVSIGVASMHRGSQHAGQLANAFEHSAARISGLPSPEGTPPEVAGMIRSAASALRHAGRSSAAQRSWLEFHARLALLADGPMASLLAALSPPLEAPFDPPHIKLTPLKKPPRNLPGPDWLWHAAQGAGEGAWALGTGLARTADYVVTKNTPLALQAQKLFKDVPGLNIAYKWNVETQAGLDYAKAHPKEFLKLLGEDAIDAKDWKNHDYAKAAGRNAFDAISLLVPFAKIGKLGEAGQAAKAAESASAAKDAAKAAQVSAQNSRNAISGWSKRLPRRPGESDAAYLERVTDYKTTKLTAAEEKLDAAVKGSEAAHKQLTAAQREAQEAAKEAAKLKVEMANETAKAVNTAHQGVSKEVAGEEHRNDRETAHGAAHSR